MYLYFLPGVLIACYGKYLEAKQKAELSKDMEEFYNNCRYQIVDSAGWTMATFLNLGEDSSQPNNRWQDMLQNHNLFYPRAGVRL